MKLRWKLLALLWLLTLLPLAVVSWLDYRRLGALAQTISQRDHAAAIRTANEHLHNMAASQATRLANGQAMVELLVRHFGAAAEMALRGPVPAAPPAVSFAEEFTDSTRRPGDIVVSERYFTLAADGTREPLPVSFESAAFRTVPGDAAVTVYDDIARLAPLQALARELYRDYGNWLHWLTVVLDNGLHLAYPGHGGYPEGFDPRSRAWYRAQIREPGLQWSRPYIDASTRQVMWTVSVPLLDAGGQRLGAAGLDIPVTDALGTGRLPASWREHARLFLVRPDHEGQRLAVAAKHSYAEGGAGWNTVLAADELQADDASAWAAMQRLLAAGEGGLAELAFRGEPALWSFRELVRDELVMVLILPTAVVTGAADANLAFADVQLKGHLAAAAAALAGVSVLAILAAWFSATRVTRPIAELERAAAAVAAGNLLARAEVSTGDELQTLAGRFNAMVPRLQEHLRMKESLNLAREVQQNLLPGSAPQVAGLDMAGRSRYCDETGGDYYDFFPVGPATARHVSLALGDVSGHGIPAALLMTAIRALLRSNADAGADPATTARLINRFLARDVLGGRFMTLFHAVVDAAAGTLLWTNAGHAPGLLYRAATGRFDLLGGEDIPLGVDGDWAYRQTLTTGLADGDVLVLATDGLWEARAPAGEVFGEPRLRALIAASHADPAERLCEAIMASVQAFLGGSAQADDITVAVLRFSA